MTIDEITEKIIESKNKASHNETDFIENILLGKAELGTKDLNKILQGRPPSSKITILQVFRYHLLGKANENKYMQAMRKKLRNVLFSICSTLVVEQNKEKQNKLISAFNEFYFATYANNDYTLASVCNENLSSEKKDIIKKALEICKK